MNVLFINNDGGGFADIIDIEESMTVETFFHEHMRHCEPEDYLIRVNRLPVARDQVLQENDRITITPVKIEGGR